MVYTAVLVKEANSFLYGSVLQGKIKVKTMHRKMKGTNLAQNLKNGKCGKKVMVRVYHMLY